MQHSIQPLLDCLKNTPDEFLTMSFRAFRQEVEDRLAKHRGHKFTEPCSVAHIDGKFEVHSIDPLPAGEDPEKYRVVWLANADGTQRICAHDCITPSLTVMLLRAKREKGLSDEG